MNTRKENNIKDEIQLKELFRVLFRNKWWSVGTFIIIIIIGTLFAFLRTPQYSATSIMKITSGGVTGVENLMEYFPIESNGLFSISTIIMSEELKSDTFLEELVESLDGRISKDKLKNAIYIYAEGVELQLTVVYSDPDLTYEINSTAVNLYINKKKGDLNLAFNNLVEAIDMKTEKIISKIEGLTYDTEEEKDLLEKDIELNYETYYSLTESKSVLMDNKDFYINRVVLAEGSEVGDIYEYFNLKRDLILVFFIALAFSVLIPFVVNYFGTLRKSK